MIRYARSFLTFISFMLCCAIGFGQALPSDDFLHTSGNKILDKQGNQVWLTGINWYGYETSINVVQGLTDQYYKDLVITVARLGFNLIRIPLNEDLVLKWAAGSDVVPGDVNPSANPDLAGKGSLVIFDAILSFADKCGLKIMLDIHSTMPDNYQNNLWYDSSHSTADWISAWKWLANRYKGNDLIIGMDLKNEPHGKPWGGSGAAKWDGSGDESNWRAAAEKAASAILAINPELLIFVEGIEAYPTDGVTWTASTPDAYYTDWWGGNLRGVATNPVNLGTAQNKLVYSPHDYGPSIYNQPWFSAGFNKTTLMTDCWRPNWFYIFEQQTAPLLIGEWGGPMEGDTATWMTALRDTIAENKLHHTFWCLNRSSIGTEGIITGGNWNGVNYDKVDFLKPILWKDNTGKYIGLDHQVVLNGADPNTANAQTNITLYYGGSLNTAEPTPEPTPIPVSPNFGSIHVLYRCGDANASTTAMAPYLNVSNKGAALINLANLTVQYYYTKSTLIPETAAINYAAMGSSKITVTFYNGYFEVGFTSGAGTLAAGAEIGEIQLNISTPNHAAYTQTDDYSFDATKTSYADWDRITAVYSGELVWGTPPNVPVTTVGPTPEITPVVTPGPTDNTTPTAVGILGDVNGNGSVDIVDALLTAQYYVGLNPASFIPANADVNKDGSIDIVDALRIAQCYVGLISCGF
jgi:endoglucanase